MSRESYTELIRREKQILSESEEINIEGGNLLAHTHRDGYHSVTEGYQTYEVVKRGTEYYVHFKGDIDKVVVYTDREDINILVHPNNVYEQPSWETYPTATINVELEVIKAFNVYAEYTYSYGGPAPYIELLRDTYAEEANPAPIGKAEVGVNLMIG